MAGLRALAGALNQTNELRSLILLLAERLLGPHRRAADTR